MKTAAGQLLRSGHFPGSEESKDSASSRRGKALEALGWQAVFRGNVDIY
jgi:hypothetical protein